MIRVEGHTESWGRQCSFALSLSLTHQPSPAGGLVTGPELRFELRDSQTESALAKNTHLNYWRDRTSTPG